MNYTIRALVHIGLLTGITGIAFAADPGFDILNKSKSSIWVTLKNGDDTVLENIEIPVQDTARAKELAKTWIKIENPFVKNMAAGSATITISEPTTLTIYTKDPAEAESAQASTTPNTYTFTKNKTIYVTYDGVAGVKGLRPQTGLFKGWIGYTEKKYDQSKQIKETDIKLQKDAQADSKKAGTKKGKYDEEFGGLDELKKATK